MPLHHYLPATYLALFSIDENLERRKRLLTMGDKKSGKIITAPASNLCGINDLYTLREDPANSQLIDLLWSYESNLAQSVNLLINKSINANIWASILIP